MIRHLAVAAALALGASLPARAQDRPAITPSRDVDVTYQMNAGDRVLRQRMRWLVAAQKLRVDPPTAGLYMIVDLRDHRIALVRDADRRVAELDAPAAGAMPGAAPGSAFTREDTDSVAGLACTDWQTTDSAGAPTLACITADGVLLRARSGGRTLVEAVSVRYAPQDPTLFQPPADYRRVTQPPPPGR